MTRSRKELLVENAFLRHQLLVAVRKVKRAKLRAADRLDSLALESLHFIGPGTDLTIGLHPSSRWLCGRFETAAVEQHRACPLYRPASRALLPDGAYPDGSTASPVVAKPRRPKTQAHLN